MAVIIGMDPHKRSATIEVVDERGAGAGRRPVRHGQGRLRRDARRRARSTRDRRWAVEGCNGIGKHIAHRLVHDGETVLDVPAKLSAQVRVFATGNGRKTDPVDAHSVAMVALRTPGLVRVEVDADLVVMGMLADRRDELGRARTQTINRLHRLLLELFPGGAKQFLSSAAGPCADRDDQTARPGRQDPPPARGRADRRTRGDRQEDQGAEEGPHRAGRPPAARPCWTCTASAHPAPPGCWPTSVTSTASPTGTGSPPGTAPHRWTPPPADQKRHRLSRAGNRRINRALHIMADRPAAQRHRGPRLLTTPGKPPARPRWRPCAR